MGAGGVAGQQRAYRKGTDIAYYGGGEPVLGEIGSEEEKERVLRGATWAKE